MTLSADNRKPENHTPHNYWSDTNGYPAPTGLFGKYIGFGEPTPHPKIDAKKTRRYGSQIPNADL